MWNNVSRNIYITWSYCPALMYVQSYKLKTEEFWYINKNISVILVLKSLNAWSTRELANCTAASVRRMCLIIITLIANSIDFMLIMSWSVSQSMFFACFTVFPARSTHQLIKKSWGEMCVCITPWPGLRNTDKLCVIFKKK